MSLFYSITAAKQILVKKAKHFLPNGLHFISKLLSLWCIDTFFLIIAHKTLCHPCLHSKLHPHHPSVPHPLAHPDSDSLYSSTRLSLSDGSEDQLDRLQQVELARTTPMSQWRAGTVQAWLEVVMAMPMYIRTCSENVKSGKVILVVFNKSFICCFDSGGIITWPF